MSSPSQTDLAPARRVRRGASAATLAIGALWLGACATGPEGMTEDVGSGSRDAAITLRDGGGDASDGAATDTGAKDGASLDATEPTHDADPSVPDAGSSDAGGADDADVPADADVSVPDASDGAVANDAGETPPDSAVEVDAGQPEAGAPDAAPPAPLNCDALVRTGVQLCDRTADTCGIVFTNRSGCTASCAAGGLVCGTGYENVEGQCARDETRPMLACDTGHESDYCVCRRP